MDTIKKPWILSGYELFATEGPKGLKVEVMAKQVNKSKSSFYHHFADLEVFTEILLNYHLERAKIIADKERLCKNVDPELFNLMIAVKQDLFFNRQLRVHRDISQFKDCFEQASKDVGEAIIGIWADALGLTGNSGLVQMVLNLSIENFYLQITEKNLTYEWLVQYLNGLKTMVSAFQHAEKHKTISMR